MIVNSVKDACTIAKNITDLEAVNVANVGRFDKSDPATKVKLTSSLLLNTEELEAAKELASLPDLDVFNQVLPSNTKVNLSQLVK